MPQQVTGPDGQSYEFPDGTSKPQWIQYFKAKGIGAPKTSAPTAPTAPFGPSATAGLQQKAVSSGPGLVSKVGSAISRFATRPLASQESVEKALYPEGGLDRERKAREKAIAEGRPGGAAYHGFQAGVREDIAGAARAMTSPVQGALAIAQAIPASRPFATVGQFLLGLGMGKSAIKDIHSWSDLADPDKLQKVLMSGAMLTGSAAEFGTTGDILAGKSAKLGEKALDRMGHLQKSEEFVRAEQEGRVLSPGRAVARQNPIMFTNAAKLRSGLRQGIDANTAKLDALTSAAKRSGVTLDVSQIERVYQTEVKQLRVANTPGTHRVADALQADLDGIKSVTLPTGQKVPVDLKRMDPEVALVKARKLREMHGREPSSPTGKEMSRVEHILAREAGNKIKGVSALNKEISGQILAEKALLSKAKEGLVGRIWGSTTGQVMMSAGMIGALKALGFNSFFEYLPAIFAFRSLAVNPQLRLGRAWLYDRVSRLLGDGETKTQPMPGASQPQAPMPVAGPGRQVTPGGPAGAQAPIQLGPAPGAGGGAPAQAAPGGGGGGAAPAQPQAAAAAQGAAAGAGAATTGAPAPMTPAAQAFQASLDRLTKALPAPPPPRFVKGQSVRLKAAEAGEVGKVTAVHGGTLTVEFKDGYRALSRDEVVRHIPEPKAKGPGANRAELRDYAKQVVAGGVVKGVSLIGSSVKGAGKDIDLLYDLGDVKLPKEPGAAADELERLLESNQAMDFDKHDTFVKAGDRYFHLSSGAGRSWVENTDYAKQQGSKPSAVLARSAAKTRSAPAAATKPQSPQGAAELQPSGSAAPTEGESQLTRQRKWRERKAAERAKATSERAAELDNMARAAGVTAEQGPSEALAREAAPGEHRKAIETALPMLESLGPQGKLLADAYKESVLSNRQMDDAEKFDTLMEMIKSARDAGGLK